MAAPRRYQPEPQTVYRFPDPERPGRVRYEVFGADTTEPLAVTSIRADLATPALDVQFWAFLESLPPHVAGYRRPQLMR